MSRRLPQLAGLAVLFAAGAIAAGVASADDTTTTMGTTITETTTTTETSPGETVISTLELTTTQKLIVPTAPTATAESSSSSGGTPAWVWVLLGILAVALVAVIIVLANRGSGVSPEERRRRLDHAVATWAAQGWALESQTADSAILRRGLDRLVVTIDQSGGVATRPLPQ